VRTGNTDTVVTGVVYGAWVAVVARSRQIAMATSTGRIAGLQNAGVSRVTIQRSGPGTYAVGADIPHGTGATIVAGEGVIDVLTASRRCTGVRCAAICIVTWIHVIGDA